MRIMALDPGDRRIGVAISDPSGTLARPLQTVVRRSRAEDFDQIKLLVENTGAGLVVVGLPLSLRGEQGAQARKVARYAASLAEVLPVPVVTWDERYSSVMAHEILETNRKRGKRRSSHKNEVDSVAAAIILQSYLDSRREDSTHGIISAS